ncbi:LAME_0H16754g1_1 [Lachancea meyersii CBS 8951]|uniref:LAME_0H16754g1_1 n=1 Tax=Lachancea meyersii CBS 8951 TaxID=1266667 RepID=A0A1G4KII6_9SACH|nr:LAME_0H16754g1_1 [Lachancea meyersii CBS 8951]
MSLRGLTVTTKNAIVTSERALLLKHAKYIPPPNMINEYPNEDALRIFYRRFIRLKPLISQRQTVRTTYVHYLRYKFKSEDYAKKISMSAVTLPQVTHSTLEEVENSLLFCLKAVSYVKKRVPSEEIVSKDIRIAKNIVKNILTVEFEKAALIAKNPRQNHPILRISFSYLSPKASSSPLYLRFSPFKEFDQCLILLNETLKTRL